MLEYLHMYVNDISKIFWYSAISHLIPWADDIVLEGARERNSRRFKASISGLRQGGNENKNVRKSENEPI